MELLRILIPSLLAALGPFIVGYATGAMSGIVEMEGFRNAFTAFQSSSAEGSLNMTYSCGSGGGFEADIFTGLVVSIPHLGAVIGSLLAGWLGDKFSRKYGLSISGFISLVGLILLAASAVYIWLVLTGRFLYGIGAGIIYTLVPLYISEISPKDYRGGLVSLIGVTFNLGLLVAFVMNIGFVEMLWGWRLSFILQAALTLLYIIGIACQPHSPRWLLLKERKEEAFLVLSKMNPLKHCHREHLSNGDIGTTDLYFDSPSCSVALKYLKSWNFLKKYFFCAGIFLLGPFCGNVVAYFSTSIFCNLNIHPFLSTALIGVMNLLGSIVVIYIIEKAGRRVSLLFGAFLLALISGTSGILIHVFRLENESHQYIGYIVVFLICLFAFIFSSTWLTIPWVMCSEVFPLSQRGFAAALTTATFWANSLVVNLVGPIILGSPVRTYGYFYILAGLCIIYFIFTLLVVPETKGVSLENMEEILDKMQCSCLRTYHHTGVGDREQKLEENNAAIL